LISQIRNHAQKAFIDRKGICDRTALYIFCQDPEMLPHIQVLLDVGASIDSIDAFGRTPLIAAAKKANVPAMEELLKRAKNKGDQNYVNKTDYFGFTALHYSAQRCDTQGADLLFSYNANPNIKSIEGERPYNTVPLSRNDSKANDLRDKLQLAQRESPEVNSLQITIKNSAQLSVLLQSTINVPLIKLGHHKK